MEYAMSVLERELNNSLKVLSYYRSQEYDTSLILNEIDQLEYAIKVLKHSSCVDICIGQYLVV